MDKLTVKQAAKEFNINSSTLYTWINRGYLATQQHPISKRHLINKDVLIYFLKNGK